LLVDSVEITNYQSFRLDMMTFTNYYVYHIKPTDNLTLQHQGLVPFEQAGCQLKKSRKG